MIQELFNIVRILSAASESDTNYDGAFSYSTEWHAFAAGCAVGFATVFPSKRMEKFVWNIVGLGEESHVMSEARSEGWYALGGVIFGALIAIAALWTLLYTTLGVVF